MTELAIHVKVSADYMSPEKAIRQKNWIKLTVCIVACLCLLGGLLQAIIANHMLVDKVPNWQVVFKKSFTPIVFTLLTIGLSVTCAFLMFRMRKYFDKSLAEEVCRIKTIFVVFTIGYFSRAVTFAVLEIYDSKNIPYLVEQLTWFIGFNFWDVIPLTMIMVFHLKKI